jgi:hypothetical protein
MLSLVTFNIIPLLVAALIGVAAGRWIFSKRAAAPPTDKPAEDADPS